MSEWTKERIAELRALYEKAPTNNRMMAGVDGFVLVGCAGYHEETDEYEFCEYGQFGSEDDAKYAYKALSLFPDALSEIERLQAENERITKELKEVLHESNL